MTTLPISAPVASIAISHDTSVPYVEFRGQPVLTFAMVDKVHCRPDGTARKRFTENRRHFVESEDFYRIDSSQKSVFRTFGLNIPPRGLIVLTESGYLLLVKSFTDDLAWQVQKQLIKTYFRAKAQAAPVQPQTPASPQITAADMRNLQRLAWQVTHPMIFEKAGLHAFWAALRLAADCPAPHRFEERHLPLLAAEVTRILDAVTAYYDNRRAMEEELCKRIIRGRADLAPFVAKLQADYAEWSNALHPWRGTLDSWHHKDIADLTHRTNKLGSDHRDCAEPVI